MIKVSSPFTRGAALAIVLMLSAACTGLPTSEPTPTVASEPTATADVMVQDFSAPDEVKEFHQRQHDSEIYGRPIFIITLYSPPYRREFRVIQLNDDGALFGWLHIVDWSNRDRWSVEVDKTAVYEITDILNAVRQVWGTGTGSSPYAISLSISTSSGYDLMSCGGNNCPQELCTIFEFVDSAITKEKPDETNLVIPCPVE